MKFMRFTILTEKFIGSSFGTRSIAYENLLYVFWVYFKKDVKVSDKNLTWLRICAAKYLMNIPHNDFVYSLLSFTEYILSHTHLSELSPSSFLQCYFPEP